MAIKNATIAAIKGERIEEEVAPRRIDLDHGVRIITSDVGGLALILGIVCFAKGSRFVSEGAAFLGGAAIAFQFAVIALGAIVLAILIGTVLSQIGIE